MMGESHFPQSADQVLDRAIAIKVATCLVGGMGYREIARELSISESRVRTVMKSELCISEMRQIANHEKDIAKATVASKARERIKKCFEVIDARLKKGDLKAVALTLRASGVFDEIETANNDTSLVVVMPGASVPSAIDVTPKDKE